MHVLHFYKAYFPHSMGGIEQFIHQLARSTQALGVETEVLALSSEDEPQTIEVDGYRVHRARQNFEVASTGFSASVFPRFAKLAKKADLIHYHFPWPLMDVVHFATRLRKPTVVSYHLDIVRQKHWLKLYRPLQKLFLSDVDHIVAAAPNYAASSPVLSQFTDKTQVIPYGLDRSCYPDPPEERMNYWRNRFKGRFFLFVGVFRYYKGLHILMEAAERLDYPIVLVGSGPVEQEIKAQASRLQLTNIHFVGKQSDEDKVALLQLCYAAVFPSHLRSEAFGIFLLEAMMFGKPMISTEMATGTSFANQHGETGLTVAPNDPQAFHQALRFFWDNPAIVADWGRAAKQRFEEQFTAQRMAESYVNLYRNCLKC